MSRPLVIAIVTAVLSPLVTSCGSGSDVHDVYTALDANGDRRRTTFYTDSIGIFCNAEYSSTKRDVTIKAVIRATAINGQTKSTIVAQNEEVPAPTSKATLSFQLVKGGADQAANADLIPWPPGKFVCEISENGKVQGSTEFSILVPNCPDGPAIAGQPCRGFYPDGGKCPGADTGTTCTCGPSGAWEGC
jgi:hypothetical protein